jgi:hypothetical protein
VETLTEWTGDVSVFAYRLRFKAKIMRAMLSREVVIEL